MSIDYRELLIKYIAHVGECEGVTFILSWDHVPKPFTPEEWSELVALDGQSKKYDLREREYEDD
jgi:hypothetical protein